MFHPGKVIRIFSPQSSDIESANDEMQAMLQMWDDNMITVLVDPNLADKVSEDDLVLVDYRPMFDQGPPTPRMIITKILRGENATRTWDRYREYFRKKKKESGPHGMVPPPQSYIG